MKLSEITNCELDVDSIVLLEKNNHSLWCSELFLHLSSMAAWEQYETAIKDLSDEEWQREGAEAEYKWIGCEGWQVFKDAVDRMYCHLRNKDIPLNDAIVHQPILISRNNSKESCYRRGVAALNIYVRLDYNKSHCSIQMSNAECVNLDCGSMAIVSGYKKHRLQGDGIFLFFQVELPFIARSHVFKIIERDSGELSDDLLFYAATAVPMNDILPELPLIKKKLEWLENKKFRKFRYQDCPVIKKFLIDNANPIDATSDERETVLKYGFNPELAKSKNLKMKDSIKIFSPEQCGLLIDFVDNHISSAAIDTVDDMPEYQVDLSNDLLSHLLGDETTNILFSLPKLIDSEFCNNHSTVPSYSIFLRLYSSETRPYIAFHHDICEFTCVVALNDESKFEGGHFILLADNILQKAPWKEGSGLLHSGNLVHGVSSITKGKRYSLVMFVNT